jgi:hypothetical protein
MKPLFRLKRKFFEISCPLPARGGGFPFFRFPFLRLLVIMDVLLKENIQNEKNT